VDDALAAERAVHAMLAARRVTSDARRGQREFFRLTVADARAVFELLRAP
jgi:hypothetical protein